MAKSELFWFPLGPLIASAGAFRVNRGERDAEAIVASAREAMVSFGVEPDYVELVSLDTLGPLERLDGEGMLAVAARIGPTRLIDNLIINTNGRS
jgi:pantoate--beta-alanine ligase